jgi:hypothetical protein
MMGLDNANYWGSAFAKSPAAREIPHDALYEATRFLVDQHENRHPAIRQWWQDHFYRDSSTTKFFDPRAIHALMVTVWQLDNDNLSQRSALQSFAEQVATAEVRILLEDVLRRAGYSTNSSNSNIEWTSSSLSIVDTGVLPTTTNVTADVALRAAHRVSTAHINNFQSNGAIVLRKVFSMTKEAENIDEAFSVAAGIACRLLDVPACRVVVSDTTTTKCLLLQVVVALKSTTNGDNDDLQPGDVWAGQDQASNETEGKIRFLFTATTADDPMATYVDPLFGKRGDTPTTVIQWSKGTIF